MGDPNPAVKRAMKSWPET